MLVLLQATLHISNNRHLVKITDVFYKISIWDSSIINNKGTRMWTDRDMLPFKWHLVEMVGKAGVYTQM